MRYCWYLALVGSTQYKQECFKPAIKILKHVIAILGGKTACDHKSMRSNHSVVGKH